MRLVWPEPADGELDRDALADLYAHGEGCVRVNFVASADGAVAVEGVSGGLEAPGDKVVFGLLRELRGHWYSPKHSGSMPGTQYCRLFSWDSSCIDSYSISINALEETMETTLPLAR